MLLRIISLVATPNIVDIPTGSVTISFEAEGSGQVEVIYSLARTGPVRFLKDGVPVESVKTDEVLGARARVIEFPTTLCRRKADITRRQFKISVTVNTLEASDLGVDTANKSCLCTVMAKPGAPICPS